MKISVKNLGPIKESTIQLGRLTLFVGPNSTGKSYLAKIFYGLLNFETRIAFLLDVESMRIYDQEIFGGKVDTFESMLEAVQKSQLKRTLIAIKKIEAQWTLYFQKNLSNFFNDEKNFFEDTKITSKAKTQLTEKYFLDQQVATIKKLQSIIISQGATSDQKASLEVTKAIYVSELLANHYYGSHGNSYYLPAARSNFVLTYRSLLKSRASNTVNRLLRSSPTEDENRYDMPLENFLDEISHVRKRKGFLNECADNMEKAMFRDGDLSIENAEDGLTSFTYVLKKAKQPIKWHNTSSMVGEISPLLSTMRDILIRGSILVIDEPESHLHPSAQKELIDHIALAINSGLRVLIITHSPYILSCVNNLIKWHSLQKLSNDSKAYKSISKKQPLETGIDGSICQAYKFGNGRTKSIQNKETLLFDESEFTDPFDEINELYDSMRNIEWQMKSSNG